MLVMLTIIRVSEDISQNQSITEIVETTSKIVHIEHEQYCLVNNVVYRFWIC